MPLQPLRPSVVLISISRRGTMVRETGLHGARSGLQNLAWACARSAGTIGRFMLFAFTPWLALVFFLVDAHAETRGVAHEKSVAITFDDLPHANAGGDGADQPSAQSIQDANARILARTGTYAWTAASKGSRQSGSSATASSSTYQAGSSRSASAGNTAPPRRSAAYAVLLASGSCNRPELPSFAAISQSWKADIASVGARDFNRVSQ